MKSSRNLSSEARGFSLLEVLVAIVIISIGILGIAGLQASALKLSKASEGRMIAVDLARDMIERLRSNAHGAKGGEYAALGSMQAGTCVPGAPAGAGLTALEDQRIWLNSIACGLPSGMGRVEVVPVAGAANMVMVTVQIQWDESRIKGGSSTYSQTVRSML